MNLLRLWHPACLAQVSKVCVTALVGNTYHASIHYLKTENGVSEEVVLDARPSDALNMAVRFKSVIYVNKVTLLVCA